SGRMVPSGWVTTTSLSAQMLTVAGPVGTSTIPTTGSWRPDHHLVAGERFDPSDEVRTAAEPPGDLLERNAVTPPPQDAPLQGTKDRLRRQPERTVALGESSQTGHLPDPAGAAVEPAADLVVGDPLGQEAQHP